MDVEWRAYGEGTERVATAFVAGVNAYVDACLEGREPMPEEFRILGYAPAKWAPEDVARIRSHGFYHNVEQEVARARPWPVMARASRTSAGGVSRSAP